MGRLPLLRACAWRETSSGRSYITMAMLLASEAPPMQAYPVSRAVNTPRNNAEQLLQEVA